LRALVDASNKVTTHVAAAIDDSRHWSVSFTGSLQTHDGQPTMPSSMPVCIHLLGQPDTLPTLYSLLCNGRKDATPSHSSATYLPQLADPTRQMLADLKAHTTNASFKDVSPRLLSQIPAAVPWQAGPARVQDYPHDSHHFARLELHPTPTAICPDRARVVQIEPY
jgi:hypothetical protein